MIRYTIAALLLSVTSALACGPDTDCVIGDRTYRIALPEAQSSPVGTLVFAHGYRGTAAGMMRNTGFRKQIADEGLALIAIQSEGDDWVLPGAPSDPQQREVRELDYITAVLKDATARFRLDPDNMVLTGFSAGGMLVWNVACAAPDLFAGYIPISGTFWAQVPDNCERPAASLIHIHGDDDSIVPLKGRPIGTTRQGDVAAAIAMYQEAGGFAAGDQEQRGELRCSTGNNPDGKTLQFCLFAGGHSFKGAYVIDALDELAR